MTTVAAGTTSKLKIRAIEDAMERLGMKVDMVIPTEVESVVPAQPFGFHQMEKGAAHRALTALQAHGSTFGIGIESGLVEIPRGWFDVPCVAIADSTMVVKVAFGALFPIPLRMVEEVRKRNTELGVIIQEEAGGGEKDPHKWLSDNKVKRDEIIVEAILCAFTPFRHPDRYRR